MKNIIIVAYFMTDINFCLACNTGVDYNHPDLQNNIGINEGNNNDDDLLSESSRHTCSYI